LCADLGAGVISAKVKQEKADSKTEAAKQFAANAANLRPQEKQLLTMAEVDAKLAGTLKPPLGELGLVSSSLTTTRALVVLFISRNFRCWFAKFQRSGVTKCISDF
jgi:hypothetical protein